MPDPSVLVSVPTVTCPGLAPASANALYVLEPVPNLGGRCGVALRRGPSAGNLGPAPWGAGFPC